MLIEQCYPLNLTFLAPLAFDCFALDKNSPKYFGFSELISGLALAIVVWTVADFRYKFRIDTATLPVRRASVVITLAVGILALLTDYWRASESRVPADEWLTPESWQLILAGSFFLVLVIWIWTAFFQPPKFNAWNARRFSKTVEIHLLRGDSTELAIVGNELERSVLRIISSTPDGSSEDQITTMQKYALRLLLAIGSPKLCRAVVEWSPSFIITLLNSVRTQCRYDSAIQVIVKNLVTAAIENRKSFLYAENDFYSSGLEGITRPVTTAFFQSSDLVRNIGTLLSPEYSQRKPWNLEQWEAYFRLLLEAFTVHVRGGAASKPSSLHWAYFMVQEIYSDLTERLDLKELRFNDDLYRRIQLLGNLVKDMITAVNEIDEKNKDYPNHILQDIKKILLSLIMAASSIRKPRQVSRKIQDNLIWDDILSSSELSGHAGEKILQELHNELLHLIYNCPNLYSIRLLGYCLNVMGFDPVSEDSLYGSSWRRLHLSLIDWVKRNLSTLLEKYPSMAHECFVDGMSYDKDNSRLVIHYVWIDGTADSYSYLAIDRPESFEQQN